MRVHVAASIRLGVSLVLMLALFTVVAPAVAAQDAATPVADPVQSAEASVAVTVSCAPDPTTDQTTCTFTSSTGAPLTVPAAAVCAPLVTVASGVVADGGYSGAGQVTLVLQGTVGVDGAATYTVGGDGAAQDVAGAGLSCVATPTTAGTGENVGDTGSVSDTGDSNQASDGTTNQPVGDGEQDGQTGVDGDAAGSPVADGTANSTDTGGSDQSAAPADDGTAGAAFTAAASPVSVNAADGDPVSVDVGLAVYNCATDPGDADPATVAGCVAAQGITVAVAQDGTALPSVFTDATGNASISATTGSVLVLTEDQSSLPSGYVPLGNGVQIINPVSEGAKAVFVNIADSGTGHLQIVSGTCPTAGEARTEFRIIGARTFGAAATACTPTPGASFTLTGGTLGPAGMVVTTGDDASWRGFMPAGTYTVIDGASSSDAFDVVADAITAVVVIDYVPMPRGSLVVTRVLCTEGDQEGTSITVGDTPQTGGPGCAANDSDFRITNAGDGTSGPSQDFTLGPDGSAQVDLTAGSYLLTDLASGQQTTVTVSEGGTTVANVRQIVLTGRAIVRHYVCSDPASNNVDPSDASYFSDTCTQALGGSALTLLDSGGNAVSTETGSGGGIITWSGLVPGSYSVTSDSGLCAVFAEGSDARAGFSVNVGQTTMVNVYSCAAPVDNGNPGAGGPGGDSNNGGTDDGTSGGGNTGAVDNTGANNNANSGAATGSAGDELKNVTQLPNTGIGNTSHGGSYQLMGALLTVLALAGTSIVATKRRTIHAR